MRRGWYIVGLVACATLVMGCRFGGSPAGTAAPDGAAIPLDGGGGEIDAVAPAADAPVASPPDALPGDLDGPAEAGAAGAGSCAPPFVSERCDPVCNTGCPVLSRCDVGAAPGAGVCIGIWIGAEGDLCLRTPSTDPCAPHHTCLDGRCRRLCYGDGDCRSAGCCNIQVEAGGRPSGYRACGPCNP